jgi:hypothetical protein
VKIQLIRLEEHDDIVSASDKLGWAQTGRVVIIWPVKARRTARGLRSMAERRTPAVPLTRRLDLILLQRRAQELGVQMAFVSRHPQVRILAQTLGIPVFKTTRDAQTLSWRPARGGRGTRRRRFVWLRKDSQERRASFRQQLAADPHRHPLAIPHPPLLVRALFFTLGMAAVITLLLALLPGARITLTPAMQLQTISLPVSASAQVASVSLAGEVPIYPLTTIVEGQASIAASATTLVPDQFASGYVRFTNLTTETITVPLGTIVTAPLTDTIRFTTTRPGVVPGGPGSSIFITVMAANPGVSANLPPNSIHVIEGALNFRLAVANIAATHGGTDRTAPSPAPADRIRVYNQLVDVLRQNALTDLEAQLSAGDILLRSTLALDEVLVKSYAPDGGMPSAELTLTLRMQFHAQTISGADLRKLGDALLNVSLPPGYTPLPDTLEIVINSQPQIDRNQIAHWQITARRSLQARLSKEKAVSLALGQPPEQAMQRLSGALPLAAPPEISIQPGWWPRIPFIPLRIFVSDEG